MREKYYWDEELGEMERQGMTHTEAALRIAGFDPDDNDGTFECGCCGETHPTDIMVAVVRGSVPQIVCLNCADEEGLPMV